jgi:hypothetical protein
MQHPAFGRVEAAAVLNQRLKHASLPDALFIAGVVAMALQSTQIGPFLPPHIWLLITLPCLVGRGPNTVTGLEKWMFLIFISYATIATIFGDDDRVKQYSQIIKFAVVYPGFFCLGRYYGARYVNDSLPLSYIYLFLLLAVEVVIQNAEPAWLYTRLEFAEGALHGTFKERNWLADYFFLYSYIIYENSKSTGKQKILLFLVLNLVVMVLSGSKTAMAACALAIAVRPSAHRGMRLFAVVIGAALYAWTFADQFSQDQLNVRLDEERGPAFEEATNLIYARPFGYGFGFVEAYFQSLPYTIRGLGEGTNSVFSVPLDLLIIAGPIGLSAWAVFFAGLGTGSFSVLAPVAALSLLNPLHQAESIYFFVAMLISVHAHKAGHLRAPASRALLRRRPPVGGESAGCSARDLRIFGVFENGGSIGRR